MKALVSLPVRDTDYWPEDAIVITGDAEMREAIEAIGSNRCDELIEVTGWPSHPEQPVLLMWEMDPDFEDASEPGYTVPGTCRLLTADEWALVARGDVAALFTEER